MSAYDFRNLSPLDFEELARDLLQEDMNLRLESFGAGRDLGIDFRYARDGHEIVVQAKRYVDRTPDAIVRAARSERDKVLKLAPTRYVFVTSASLSPSLKLKVRNALRGVPLALGDIIGREDLNNLLRRHPRIERRHFKLWLGSTSVLERILRSGVYNRTQTEMDAIRRMVPKFVSNDSVRDAERILSEHGVVVIAGEPGVGKSTLARMLVWLHAEQGWNVHVVDDLKEAFDVAGPDERRLIFFDDFLGQVQLSADIARSTDQRFPSLVQRVRDNANLRLVMTTRSYLFHQAQAVSGRLSDPSLSTKRMLLDVGYYTREIKARILFNHIFFSGLSAAEVEGLLDGDFLLEIIDHENFSPRIIDLVTSTDYLRVLGVPVREAMKGALDDPTEIWGIPYRSHLSDEARALLLAVFLNPPMVAIGDLEGTFRRMLAAMGIAVIRADRAARFRSAMKELEGSAIAIRERRVGFSNPGVRDFLRGVVIDDGMLPEAVRVAEEQAELGQCEVEARAVLAAGRRVEVAGATWAAAVERVCSRRDTGVLKRIRLAVRVHGIAPEASILAVLSRLRDELREGVPDGPDVEDLVGCMEALAGAAHPIDQALRLGEAVAAAVAGVVERDHGGLSLADIKSLLGKVDALGAADEATDRAFEKALRSLADNVDAALNQMEGLGELDEFEADLTSLMTEFGICRPGVLSSISDFRDYLEERDRERPEDDRYEGSEEVAPGPSEDEQILSMFDVLRSR